MERCRAHSCSDRFLKAGLIALLALLLCGAVVGAAAAAASDTSGGIKWSLADDGTLTISPADSPQGGAKGEMPDYSAAGGPWATGHKDELKKLVFEGEVLKIGKNAFRGCSGFTGSLTIPNSVTSIGNSAFYSCSQLTGSLTIPNSVTSIGSDAFSGCTDFTSLTIGSKVETIGDNAFDGCSGFENELTIPNSVTSIGKYAFRGCTDFTSLTIGSKVETIGNHAFENCSKLTGPLTIPGSVTTIGEYAFSGCSKLTGSLTIPGSVTTIGNHAFENCSELTGSLTIPGSVTTIGESAFRGCSGFTGSLTIPGSVTKISNYAFSGCSKLTGSLTIPGSVTTIGTFAFKGCSGFTSLTIGSNVETIDTSAFENCRGFTALTIPSTVKNINNNAFKGCGLTEPVAIPVTVVNLGTNIFNDQIRDGYTFGGWYNNPQHSGSPVSKYEAGNTYYPKWTVSEYTVTFDLQGHGDNFEDQVDPDTPVTRPSPDPTTAGYTFEGWYKEAACSTIWDFNDIITKNTTIYAKWTAKTTTVTLDPNDGSTGTFPTVTATYGADMPAITLPTRAGYTFTGYYDASTAGTKYYNADGTSAKKWDKDSATATLYAQWTANTYTVKFTANGGTGTAMADQPFTYGVAQNLSANTYTRAGYTFAGWHKDSAGTTVDYTDKQSVSNLTTEDKGTVTLYAVWAVKEPKSITKGTMSGGDVIVSSDGTEKTPIDKAVEGTTVYLKPVAATGYTYTAASLTAKYHDGSAEQTIPLTETSTGSGIFTFTMVNFPVTVTAAFAANQYAVTLNPNGGTAGTATEVTATYGQPMPALTDAGKLPTREGYTFTGYYDDVSAQYYTAAGVSAKNWDKAANTTLYAHWTPKTYTITLSAPDAVDKQIQTVIVTYDSSLITPAIQNPVKHGYSLDGWYMNGTEVIDEKGQFVSGVAGYTDAQGYWIHDGDITLTAELTPTKKENVEPSEPGEPAEIDAETIPDPETNLLVKVVSADNVSTASFDADKQDLKNPDTDASGYRLEKTYTVYQMTAEAVSGNVVPVTIRVQLSEGDNPNNVILRHYTGTYESGVWSGSWDSTPIRPAKITELPESEGPYTHEFIFNVSKFSPFALTYEIPVKKSSSSQGSSVWLTETPEPTVTPTPTAEPTQGPTPGVPTVKPTETQTPASPMPIMGILAGLGCAAVVFGLRRK